MAPPVLHEPAPARRSRPVRFLLVSADERAIVDGLHAEPEWPRQDVVELAQALDAELLSYSDFAGASWFTRKLVHWVGKPTALAWLAFRRGGTFYFANAENTALPLALLLKLRPTAKLAFIGHRLTTRLKTGLVRAFNLLRDVSVVFCYSRLQERHLVECLGFPIERVRRIPFQVDEQFFTPSADRAPGRGVVSVGREMRDYPTLFAACEGTGVPVTVVASSPWSRRADPTANRTIPDNVTLRRNVSNRALRDLYRDAAVVVVPLVNVEFPAGITAVLEAQACGRPVIVSASEGIIDTLEPGSAMVVPCCDPAALRAAVLQMIEQPGEAAQLGARGREGVLQDRTLARWVSRISEACGAPPCSARPAQQSANRRGR
jgi:glycosyltransferase involved in cell wall biosynthesis